MIELNPVPAPPVIEAVPSVKVPPVTVPLNVPFTALVSEPLESDAVPSLIVAVRVLPVSSVMSSSANVLPASCNVKPVSNCDVIDVLSPFSIRFSCYKLSLYLIIGKKMNQ